jgi:hypothetical protein
MLHNPEALGKITSTPGVLVSLVANLAAADQGMRAHWVSVQSLPANSGYTYIGWFGMVTATGVGVLHILQPGETWSLPPSAVQGNVFAVADLYLDVETGGEGVLVSAYVV